MNSSTSPVDIRPDHLEIAQDILREHLPAGFQVWVFGSRANWTTKDSSDLDLAVEGADALDYKAMVGLEVAFEESDLPYTVDVVDLNAVNDAFRLIVEGQRVPLPLADRQAAVNREWREMPFSQAVQVNPAVRLERGTIYPFVDMAAVNADSRSAYPSEERPFKGGGSRFQSGDTLMARITPCLENGKIARYCAPNATGVGHGSTEFIVIRGRPDVTDNDFAYYLTQWEEVRNYAVGQMTGTSGRQRVPVDSLDHLTISLPPLPEQRRIAQVLGTLDDKIEMNRRMNETLEQMARAIFQDWFVDFGSVRAKLEGREPYLPSELWDLFPDRLVDSELGEIPEGWEVGCLGDVANSPVRSVAPASVADGTPYIGLEHMPRRSITLAEWENADKVTSNKLAFCKGEFIFGKLRPYFHKVGIAPVDGICSTDAVVVSPPANIWSSFVLGCISTDKFVAYTDQTSTGTRMPRTNWKAMSQFGICLPPEQLAGAFQNTTQHLLDRIVANIHESRALVAKRDALLPRLVSGELQLDTTGQ